MVCDGDQLKRVQFDPCIESLPSGGFREVYVEEELSLEEEIVRYLSVSLSPTLNRNEKVEYHIRKKTTNLMP